MVCQKQVNKITVTMQTTILCNLIVLLGRHFEEKFQLINLILYYVGLQCGTAASALPAAGTVEAHCLNPSNLLPELTLGEKMSQILKDQTDQLIKKVKSSVSIYTLH